MLRHFDVSYYMILYMYILGASGTIILVTIVAPAPVFSQVVDALHRHLRSGLSG